MKSRYTSFIIASLIGISLVAAPVVSFAKNDNGKGNGNNGKNAKVEVVKKAEKQEKNSDDNKDRGCLRAFGHLIAPGWIKHNGAFGIGDDCHLPFGIAKKFRGQNATSTVSVPDTTAPVLSAVITNPAKYQAEVRWMTDERSDSTIFVSTTSPVDINSTSVRSITKGALVRDHRIVIRNLAASTTYYVIVRSRDASGNSSVSGTNSFMTKGLSPDTQAPVISNVVTLASTSTIQVGWKTNELTTGRIYYSLVLPVNVSASTTQVAGTSTTTINHILNITGLNPSTTYYMVVESTDGSGNVSTSGTFAATTGAYSTSTPDVTPPTISSPTVTVASSTATVAWTTSELATSKVFYSTSTPVNITATTTPSLSNSALVTNHSLTISGLATSTPYYLVIQSADASNNVQTSAEIATTTLAL